MRVLNCESKDLGMDFAQIMSYVVIRTDHSGQPCMFSAHEGG